MATIAHSRGVYGGWLTRCLIRIRGLLKHDHVSELRDLDESSLSGLDESSLNELELRPHPLDRPFRME